MSDGDYIEFKIVDGRKYSKEHLWFEVVNKDDHTFKIGISDFLQADLGDILRVILPQRHDVTEFKGYESDDDSDTGNGAKDAGPTGDEIAEGETLVTLRSEDESMAIESPFSGHVIELNGEVEDAPELINDDAYGDGWLMIVKPHDFEPEEELLEPEEYLEHLHEI
jgi:glycine cleavage system H protein